MIIGLSPIAMDMTETKAIKFMSSADTGSPASQRCSAPGPGYCTTATYFSPFKCPLIEHH